MSTSMSGLKRASAHVDEVAESYLNRLTRQRLLTHDEEVDLSRLAHAGDSLARQRLVEANMRLVISIARRYHCALIPFEDLVQEGAIGLMTAIERFDPTRGFRFSTYATHWIKQAVSRAIDNKSRAIRVPAHVSETIRKLERIRAELFRETGEEPSPDLIAKCAGISSRKVDSLLRAGQDTVSLDTLVGDDENTPLSSLLDDKNAADPEDELMRGEMREELIRMLNQLTERERLVMRRRLGIDDGDSTHVLNEIAHDMHLSRERVRQIEIQALRHLRALARKRHLNELIP